MLSLLLFSLLIGVGVNSYEFASSLQVQENELKIVPCPGKSHCSDGETCCQISSGDYACCPHPDAVCCSDHIHCCPTNHTCDLESRHCRRKLDQINKVSCPDGITACPDGFTCCALADAGYGCCPSNDAVCCSDHLHCCPQGHVCNMQEGKCDGELSIPWLTKKVAFRTQQKLTKIINKNEINISPLSILSKLDDERICPDATTLCPVKSTCCLISNEKWGCCPVENAVCCSDHSHCCPAHYQCDLHVFKCNHDQFGSIPMLKKELPINKISSNLTISSKSSSSISIVQCPDGNYCPEETTCCQLKDNTYGCCPYADGTCCSDQTHCCGNGYSCDESGTRCVRHFDQINKMKKLISKNSNDNQICPDGKTTCSSSSTCCPNKQNNEISYSCCPYSKGVCCGSNGSVCCPNDYDCNEDQLSCELRDDSIILRRTLLTSDYYQCLSETSVILCSSDQTCCPTYGTADADVACCVYPDGQCCSDGQHCCPSGTNCDMDIGGCV